MWDDVRALNTASAALVVLSVIAILSSAIYFIARQPMFLFREVTIDSVSRADFAHIAVVARGEIKGTFFTQDLERVRAALKKIPWIKTAGLYRQWPNRLAISIEEYVPFATWNDHALVTKEGDVFYAPFNGELPALKGGNDADAVQVVGRFIAWRERLAMRKVVLTGITFTSRGSWSITAKDHAGDLTIELGKEFIDERFDRMLSVYPQTVAALRRAGTKVSAVDLRYKNGLAVRVVGQSKE